MIIQHNMAAENTNRELGKNVKTNAKSIEKLSSGYRINRAADDAAGLAISEKMRAQIRGLDKGSFNSSEGIALLQVADGALSEVHSILDRIKELTVQASNDTYTDEDRGNIQLEMEALLDEINRIGKETEYNTIKVFQGGEEPLLDPDGEPITIDEVPFSDITLNSLELDDMPFSGNDGGSRMQFQARLVEGYSPSHSPWNLVYGSGSTSYPSLRVTYEDENGMNQEGIFDFQTASANSSSFEYNTDNPNSPYVARTFTYNINDDVSFDIVQKIQIVEGADYKYYDVSYKLANTGTKDAEVDFMYHVDTAYDNQDLVESYCTNGSVVERTGVYTSNPDYTSASDPNIHPLSELNASSGITITNISAALPFSENIRWTSANTPDTVVIGRYSRIHDWSDYDNLDGTNSMELGSSTQRLDLGYSLVWSDKEVGSGATMDFKLQYGIVGTDDDPNIPQDQIVKKTASTLHSADNSLWIQTGANSYEGFYAKIGEMNTTVLGIRSIDLSTVSGAEEANAKTEAAIESLNRQRATIGAQHNRLEHVISVDDISSENTQASESKIRDTDMAKEMVVHAAKEILIQAGQAMLVQSNNITEGVLQLLR